MLGDGYVTLPSYEATFGVTIDAVPAAVWPWLMQMGFRRGGLYSYDWLDRLFGYLDAPSAEGKQGGSTRLVSRNRVWTRKTLRARLTMLVITPAAFVMTRKMLLGIKRRAESLHIAGRKVAA